MLFRSTYSKEEDTPAALMEGQVDEDVKEERRNEIMAMQQDIVFAKNEDMIGRKLKVIVEGKLPDDEAPHYSGEKAASIYIGRTYKDAPDVDGYIFMSSDNELMSGEFLDVEVVESKDYDLIGLIL